MSIRLFPKRRLSGSELVGRGSLNDQMLAWLRLAVIVRYNILVSGGTASGKTTLLNALSSYIPPSERVITVEDTKEMQLDLPNLLCLEAPHRTPRDSSAQRIDMAYLIRTTLRMHPNRIFVGEIRDGAAALAYLHAINTGHDGCCSTIHANNTVDALERMQTLVAGGGGGALPFDVVRSQVRNNLHVLVHAEFTPQHGRRVVEIAELRRQEVVPLWTWDYATAQHIEHTENVRSSVLNQRAHKFGALASLT